MALLFSFSAAGFAAFSNWIFRKASVQNREGTRIQEYLIFFYFLSFLTALTLSPSLWKTPFHPLMGSLGAAVGLLNVFLMRLTSKALTLGPSGLTFAFQNASAIFPGLLLFLIFGPSFGFSCTFLHLIGMTLALCGLFLGQKGAVAMNWLKIALACFSIQVIALTLIQGRCILFDCKNLPFLSAGETDDVWFMPCQFGAAFCLQALLLFLEGGGFHQKMIGYGSLGGIANGAATALLLLATKKALPLEKALLFPSFSVAVLLLCNLWANRLYQEKFNWKTNLFCASGIFLGLFQ